MLTDNGLSYSKSRGEVPIHNIPAAEMLAVERVDDSAFNMKFVSEVALLTSAVSIGYAC